MTIIHKYVSVEVDVKLEDYEDDEIENEAWLRGLIDRSPEEGREDRRDIHGLCHFLVDNFSRKDFPFDIVTTIETITDRFMK
jgi:hypothetical protein